MKYFSYFPGILLTILFSFFFLEYLQGHTYYYNFLSDFGNVIILFFGLIASLIPIAYLFYGDNSKKWSKLLFLFFLGFIVFSIGFFIQDKNNFVGPGFFLYLFNFLILFIIFGTITVGATSIGDFSLQRLVFKEKIYDLAIKTGLGFGILGLILFYLIVLRFMNTPVSVCVFVILIFLIFWRRKNLKLLFDGILLDFQNFTKDLNDYNKYLKYIFMLIFSVCLIYIYFGFIQSFIPYPSAWDANHAYMFIPKVLAEYGGYPWSTDFRPALELQTSFLTWIYNLGFFTTFSQDTWMTTFNFLSGIFSLFFGFMLISILLKLIKIEKGLKYYILLFMGYLLLLAWLTSGMGAFLVFVDNKTDLALFMFVILGLFLAVYSLFKQETEIEENKNNIYVYFAIAGFFFGIANFIKPTGTFDFFGTFIVFATVNIGFIVVLGAILFVVGFLYFLKYRGFDKLFSGIGEFSKYFGIISMIAGFAIGIFSSLHKFFKEKFKVLSLFVFLGSFILTLLISKGFFGLFQVIYDKNVVKNPGKIAISFITSNKFPTTKTDIMTGSLYSGVSKTVIGSSYNEDNGRYVGYGNKEFINPWRSFLVPSSFKNHFTVYFDKNKFNKNVSIQENKIYAFSGSDISNNIVKKYTQIIVENRDNELFKDEIKKTIESYERKLQLNQIAEKFSIDFVNKPSRAIKNELVNLIYRNNLTQLQKQVETILSLGKLNILDYPKILQTEKNKKLLESFSEKTESFYIVSIPYSYLVPFNVVFNWSLQNHSSYYTDIGVVWLMLFIISIFAFIYSIFIRNTIIFAFSFATLITWGIWYGVASGIVWYNIGGIVWLIIVAVLYSSKLKDKRLLPIILIFVSVISIILNLFRISGQSQGQIQFWYKGSIGEQVKYIIGSNSFVSHSKEIKIPYTAQDIFNLQFSMYNKPIKSFNERSSYEAGIIGGTYMRYFVKNQNKIINDQFLINLWKMFSDSDVNNSYLRLKDQNITDIVIDPNIASVVVGTGNKSLWYRYYGETDSNGNIEKLGVLPMFAELAHNGKIEYGYSNNLGIKYALTVSDSVLRELSGKTDQKELMKLRYQLTSLRFLGRMLGAEIQNETILLFQKILSYRIEQATKGNSVELISDLADIDGIQGINYLDLISKKESFNKMTFQQQTLLLRYSDIIGRLSQNQNNIGSIINEIASRGLGGSAQLLYVKVK